MFGKLCKSSSVKNILVFSLSNLGDVIVTCPVIDVLLRDFPAARISVIVGPNTTSLFTDHPWISTIIYDKHLPWTGQLCWFWKLRRMQFDVIIDLRQTALGLFLPCRWRTPLIPRAFDGHMRLKHLQRLKTIYPDMDMPQQRLAIIPKSVQVAGLSSRYVIIAPGAADSGKRWFPQGFTKVADQVAAQGTQVIFVGGSQDTDLIEGIRKSMQHPSLSLAGKTDLRELAFMLQGAQFALTHDSGAMHLASYLDVPVVGLWGPTDMSKSGPWSCKGIGISKGKQMSSITVEDVLDAIAKM